MQPENYITTFRKHRFSPIEPMASDIEIGDIAHALSYLCRANGHFSGFFSVAKHCLNCVDEAKARKLPMRVQLIALLHDASEAYIGDMTRPVKRGMSYYQDVERRLQGVIWEALGIIPTREELEAVSDIDDTMLYCEFLHFTGEKVFEKPKEPVKTVDFDDSSFLLTEDSFLKLYYYLKHTLSESGMLGA